ncbi:MAG: hypothetical protein PVF83_08300 [Anaerolineales bacterium]|jgi:hypothetical protein
MQEEKTISEKLFEQFCNRQGIRFEPIPRKPGKHTSDYRIWLNEKYQIIVEVKQMDWNKADKKLIENVRKGKEITSSFRTTGHKRIGKIIKKAYSQLKNSSEGIYPAIIVVYDNTQGLSHLDYEDILNGMYGDEVIVDPFQNSGPYRHKFGGNRKLTPYHNRVVSAIALLNFKSDTPSLSLFHNIHANICLNPDNAWQIADRQFTLQKGTDAYQFWSEIRR